MTDGEAPMHSACMVVSAAHAGWRVSKQSYRCTGTLSRVAMSQPHPSYPEMP